MEATAWEIGFVPETRGLSSDQLEQRIQGLLPPLALWCQDLGNLPQLVTNC